MSQAANTFWVNRVNSYAATNSLVKRQMRFRRFVDALVIMVILAATAICISVYVRTRAEMTAAEAKHQAASTRVEELRVDTERLEREVLRLKNDPKLIETVARQSLGLVRSGEVIIKTGQGGAESTDSNKRKAGTLTQS
ncbi:MAG TPA: septum formation initiator family protein [Blastocatellia bacterium]|nr:septum formation initiator family protein [Blastocatellia bacterium]